MSQIREVKHPDALLGSMDKPDDGFWRTILSFFTVGFIVTWPVILFGIVLAWLLAPELKANSILKRDLLGMTASYEAQLVKTQKELESLNGAVSALGAYVGGQSKLLQKQIDGVRGQVEKTVLLIEDSMTPEAKARKQLLGRVRELEGLIKKEAKGNE